MLANSADSRLKTNVILNAGMVRAWLDWQLKDKQENARLFLDGDLTDYDGFTIQHKNFE